MLITPKVQKIWNNYCKKMHKYGKTIPSKDFNLINNIYLLIFYSIKLRKQATFSF